MTATKVEPTSTKVNVEAVSEIGIQQVRTKPAPMFEGPGLKAPMTGTTTYENGSQGKH